MQLRQHPARTERASIGGYSLIELVVVVVLISIVAGTAFFVVLESMRVYSRAQPRMEASYEANLVADRLTRDIRDIPDRESIQGFGEHKLEFTSSTGSIVTYEFAEGVLLRNQSPLAENLKDFAFGFSTAGGTGATTSEEIHLVHLKLVAHRAAEAVPLALAIFPRGLQP